MKNSAEDSGGGIMNSADKSILTSCTFIGNSAENDGGGMSNYGESTPTLTDCKFISNFSRNGGGGMSNGHQSSPTLTNCVFIANHAEGYGGGIAVYSGCESALANCIFLGNVAHFGGGMSSSGLGGEGNPIRSNYSILVNCTFNGNFARVLGGGILNAEGSKSKMGNCILWGNRDSSGIGESAQFDNTRSDLVSAVDNCCIQGWTGNLGGTGNFGRDPLFVDPNGPDGKIGTLDDNLRLAPASPCRDAGDNSTLPLDTADLDKDGDVRETIPFDIEGKPRILNGAVDLGAYESG
ncbi:MAG: hypothetical protein H8E73_07170 [Planctomycetes bacterium]|nr:hypothetical protein [Planctomycetota bacterium]